jgi:hypothetical protein
VPTQLQRMARAHPDAKVPLSPGSSTRADDALVILVLLLFVSMKDGWLSSAVGIGG